MFKPMFKPGDLVRRKEEYLDYWWEVHARNHGWLWLVVQEYPDVFAMTIKSLATGGIIEVSMRKMEKAPDHD